VQRMKTYTKAEEQRIERALKGLQAKQKLLQAARVALTPDVRMRAGVVAIRGMLVKGQDPAGEIDRIRRAYGITEATGRGTIRGTVRVEGAVPDTPVEVVAFDTLGYVADVGRADGAAGRYVLTVPPGRYYVMTVSTGYVDEMYQDVPAPFGSKAGWRSATLVEVGPGADVTGIDFDLSAGATITGTIYDSDGYPLTDQPVTLQVTGVQSPVSLLEYEVWTDPGSGTYTIHVPAAGLYKLAASASGYTQVWYDGKESWAQADTLVVPSPDAVVTGVDFTLSRQGEGIGLPSAGAGGAISGVVKGPGGLFPVVAALTVAFDLADSSVAGFGLALLGNPYVIGGLEEGSYLVYADDILGDLLGFGNYVGEFYDDAQTPDEATPVQVTDNDTTSGIDFVLEEGGKIKGTVTGPSGQPLDSVLVVAIDAQILSAANDPFLTHVRLGLALTDGNGEFTLSGLRTGDYVLRTFTVIKHVGEVLDEYWDGHHSIWSFREADLVHVQGKNVVRNINFTLDAGGRINGHVYASDGSTPIPETVVLALNADSNLPELVYGEAGEDGSYTLSPLATGDYKLLAISGDGSHLSEFYDNAYRVEDADIVHVDAPNATNGIDFTLNEGGVIQGYVYLPDGMPVGADTTYRFPVVAYDAHTGLMVDYAYVQFPGGFRIQKLLPGEYKVAALPILYGYAVTYAGGGDTFDDPASQSITVVAGAAADVDITLEQGTGSIVGKVVEKETGAPLDFAVVMAYDATGHAAGLGLAGADPEKMLPSDSPGEYAIRGLRPGSYYVRTFAFTHIFPQVSSLDLENFDLEFGEGDFPELPGLGGGFDLFNLYQDEWYDGVPVQNSKITLDALYSFALAFARHGVAEDYEDDLIPFYVPLPFQDTPAPGASAVAVSDGGETTVDFALSGASVQQITDVENERTALPSQYELSQAYPNPFNPSTRLTLALPRAGRVRVTVYDLLGHVVRHLVDGPRPAGVYTLSWNATNDRGEPVPSGVYFVRAEAGSFKATRKVLLLK
ncbi:MAG TPA: T9SS type A sorting domain-containing protein, partial [Bacteroidetes bacterium]|nr:T9SS type A sorting domain-containing protein [Bacteroidota bacterium]